MIALGRVRPGRPRLLDQLSTDFTTFAVIFGAGLLGRSPRPQMAGPSRRPDPAAGGVTAERAGTGHDPPARPRREPHPTDPDYVAQLGWFVLAIVLFVAVLLLVRDHRVLQRYTYTAMLVGLLLLVLPLLPFIGTEINGARIWVRLTLGAVLSASSPPRSPRSC